MFTLSDAKPSYYVTCTNAGSVCRRCQEPLVFDTKNTACVKDYRGLKITGTGEYYYKKGWKIQHTSFENNLLLILCSVYLFPASGWGFRSMTFFVPNFHYVNLNFFPSQIITYSPANQKQPFKERLHWLIYLLFFNIVTIFYTLVMYYRKV